jgi:hypothetical protein
MPKPQAAATPERTGDFQATTIAENGGALDYRSQFAHVAGPRISR